MQSTYQSEHEGQQRVGHAIAADSLLGRQLAQSFRSKHSGKQASIGVSWPAEPHTCWYRRGSHCRNQTHSTQHTIMDAARLCKRPVHAVTSDSIPESGNRAPGCQQNRHMIRHNEPSRQAASTPAGSPDEATAPRPLSSYVLLAENRSYLTRGLQGTCHWAWACSWVGQGTGP